MDLGTFICQNTPWSTMSSAKKNLINTSDLLNWESYAMLTWAAMEFQLRFNSD